MGTIVDSGGTRAAPVRRALRRPRALLGVDRVLAQVRSLGHDLETVRTIARRKARVKARLLETGPRWCRPGRWRIEGSYARHESTDLPAGLRDAIHGIWKRPLARALTERAVAPWRARMQRPAGNVHVAADCSIAYLSNGGRWKLFDLGNARVWTRLRDLERARAEQARIEPFRMALNIPDCRLVDDAGTLWRSDRYVSGINLALCRPDRRLEITRTLAEQYARLAMAMATPANPDFTSQAVGTLCDFAPASLPAQLCGRHLDRIHEFGASLPIMPAHGDLSAQNVFVAEGQPWILDWDEAGRKLPVLYDVLYLVTREAELDRFDLLAAFLDGAFDEGIPERFGGACLHGGPHDRLLLIVHAYAVRFHWQRTAGQRDANAHNVDDVWAKLRSYCMPSLK
jgi:hypothetical protein